MKATKHRFWLCALLVCMVLSAFAGITAPPAMAANISSTDWMEAVPDETKLSNMSIPVRTTAARSMWICATFFNVRTRALPRS